MTQIAQTLQFLMVMTIINDEPRSRQPAFTTAALRRGIIAALPFIVSNGIAGVVIGVAYRSSGLGWPAAVLFSLVVYSATAQSVTLSMWSLPPPIAAMAVTCMVTNARYLVMSAHLRQLFAGVPRRVMLPILFLLADASWLMTTADAEQHPPDAGYLLGSSLPMAIGWIGGTAVGYGLPLRPTGPLATAATLLPLVFVVTLLPMQWRGCRSLLPWAASAVTAIAMAALTGQSWAMLVGGSLGTLVSATRGDDV